MTSAVSKFLAASALALTFVGQALLPAQAGEVQNRINTQQSRISAGVQSGQIGPRHAARDERRIARIQRARNRDLRQNGGTLKPGQYRRLNARLNNNSNHIYNQRHN